MLLLTSLFPYLCTAIDCGSEAITKVISLHRGFQSHFTYLGATNTLSVLAGRVRRQMKAS